MLFVDKIHPFGTKVCIISWIYDKPKPWKWIAIIEWRAASHTKEKTPFPFHSNESTAHTKCTTRCIIFALCDCCAVFCCAVCFFSLRLSSPSTNFLMFFGTHWMWLSECVYIKIMSQTRNSSTTNNNNKRHVHTNTRTESVRVRWCANCDSFGYDHERKSKQRTSVKVFFRLHLTLTHTERFSASRAQTMQKR